MTGAAAGLAIVGTDTGVGKTLVTAALHLALRRRGVHALPWKPVGSGGVRARDGWVSPDALWWKRMLRLPEPVRLLNPVCYRLPLAPWVAARLEQRGGGAGWQILKGAWQRIRRTGPVLVEGVGGVLVPLQRRFCVADLIQRLRIPAVIVGRAGLGGINQVLLTAEALRARGIPLAGVILNGARRGDAAARTNPDAIAALGALRILAVLPWAPGIGSNRATFERWARRLPAGPVTRVLA